MPKGKTTGDLDAYKCIALGKRDMRMLQTPLMRRFKAVLARKGLAEGWQFGATPGSPAGAPVFLVQRRLQRGREENHAVAFDVSKTFGTAQHGHWLSSYTTWGSRRSSLSSSIPSAAASRCALSPHMAPLQAAASTEA